MLEKYKRRKEALGKLKNEMNFKDDWITAAIISAYASKTLMDNIVSLANTKLRENCPLKNTCQKECINCKQSKFKPIQNKNIRKIK